MVMCSGVCEIFEAVVVIGILLWILTETFFAFLVRPFAFFQILTAKKNPQDFATVYFKATNTRFGILKVAIID